MEEKSLFEELGVQYQEKDGIHYPLLSVSSEECQLANVGKYGRMWIGFLKEAYAERYRSLVRFGKLYDKASEINEEAYELLENIETVWLEKNKPKDPNSFMEQLHLRNQARMMAEEIVLREVVRKFH
ncbi:TnpV protein [Candidatus Galacturonibacter soehngenii]|uniref:TnpV protein n=1 Tax=Candidatus Galacturonatibacter soehngenii TaxID=2307010 RepID=A0A7V7QKW3_9FIRM|nr:TnpV protein [Candidatus Galacturonibacter soehngenii]KAB1438503.1 TnpV protein [Candidatus Galacturonibacter soehngenii]